MLVYKTDCSSLTLAPSLGFHIFTKTLNTISPNPTQENKNLPPIFQLETMWVCKTRKRHFKENSVVDLLPCCGESRFGGKREPSSPKDAAFSDCVPPPFCWSRVLPHWESALVSSPLLGEKGCQNWRGIALVGVNFDFDFGSVLTFIIIIFFIENRLSRFLVRLI